MKQGDVVMLDRREEAVVMDVLPDDKLKVAPLAGGRKTIVHSSRVVLLSGGSREIRGGSNA